MSMDEPENRLVLSEGVMATLAKARVTYGYEHQIVVSIGELCELGSVLAKYPRYGGRRKEALYALHSKAVDEVADVMIILDHVRATLGIGDDEISAMIEAKAKRLQRWIEHSPDPLETMQDRRITQE